MNIIGCQGEDLELSYRDYGASDRCYEHLSRVMLELLEAMRQLPVRKTVYGLTSHQKLCLLSQDDYDSAWWITIDPEPLGLYRVSYLMQASVAPWPGAYVTGVARSLGTAIDMILIGMENSGGWNEPSPGAGA
jgi:hypothetical protein